MHQIEMFDFLKMKKLCTLCTYAIATGKETTTSIRIRPEDRD